jgi:AcrR family transcriptional regulator
VLVFYTILRVHCQHNSEAVWKAENMARQPDPDLEDRILNAARRLWKRGASKALTMRAVARVARTNTPAVYRRFPHREDILRALLERTRREIFQQLDSAPSVAEACERYVDYALSHPHEYELYYLHEYDLLFSDKSARAASLNQLFKEKRPAVEMMKGKLASQLGGIPDDYGRLTLAVWALVHGTAMLLIAKTVHPEHAGEMRIVCAASVDTLLREASRSRAQK